MLPSQAVGIDLGTTYSSIAHLDDQGDPVRIASCEGELSTPSVLLVTHHDNIVALTRVVTREGEIVVVKPRGGGRFEIVGRIPPDALVE